MSKITENVHLQAEKSRILNMPIQPADFSTRSYNCLRMNHVDTVGDLLNLTYDDINRIRGMSQKSTDEIMNKINKFRNCLNSFTDNEEYKKSYINFETWMKSDEGLVDLKSYLKEKDTTIDAIEALSARAYNLLSLKGADRLYMLVGKTASDITSIFKIDGATAAEIASDIEKYILANHEEYESVFTINEMPQLENSKRNFDVYAYQDKVTEYYLHNDYNLRDLGLSNRAQHALDKAGYKKISEIIFFSEEKLLSLPSSGKKTAHEIYLICSAIMNKNMARIKAYCLGDQTAVIDEDRIHDQILSLYKDNMNDGFSYEEIKEKVDFHVSLTSERLKHILGKMISSGEIEYVDGYCFRIYGKFVDYYRLCEKISERDRKILEERLQGKTLEEIGTENGFTRERTRQIQTKALKKVYSWYFSTTGMKWFDEDYFRYLFEKYQIGSNNAQWFGISGEAYRYLDMSYTHGKTDLNEALSDSQIDLSLKLRIRVYLNRKKLRIGNEWLPRNRRNLMEYYIRNHCIQPLKVNNFITKYNAFCKENDLSEDLLIKNEKTVANYISESHLTLYHYNAIFRFYDIDSHDYTDLIEGIGLADYENTEVSTLKFIEDYPNLMKKYDIHDQFELHNLLKKIIQSGSFNDIQFIRMPNIRFGKFDRKEAIMGLIRDNSPIKLDELINLIHEKYGYDKATLAGSVPTDFSEYCHQGVVSVPDVILPDEQIVQLRKVLTKDFYFTDEIRTIYMSIYPDAKPDNITPFNLKKIGFSVYSSYVVQHFESAKQYFKYILTKDEQFDFAPYRRRFGYIQIFRTVEAKMKADLQLIEYEPDQMVQICKIENSGFSRDDLLKFRDAVWNNVPFGKYFTIHSIRKAGFSDPVENLGFEEWFYGDVLTGDNRLSSSRMLQNIVFCKGKDVTLSSFIGDVVRHNDRGEGVDRYDLLNILTEGYGCIEPERWKLNEVLKSAGIYYDDILDRFYVSEDTYLDDLNAGEHV